MGLLNKILIFLVALLIAGCAKSIIKISASKDVNPYGMFGKTNERNNYLSVTTSDSLKLIWENDTHGSFNNSSVSIYDSLVFVGDLGGRVHVFDLNSGSERGVLKTKGAVFTTPVLFGYNLVYALALENENASEIIFYDYYSGKELNLIEVDGLIINQILVKDENFFFCTYDGRIYKYDFANKKINEIRIKSFVNSVPAMSNNKLLIPTTKGEIIIIDSDNMKILQRNKISKAFFSGITVAGENYFIGDDEGTIHAFTINSNKQLWKFATGSRIMMNPVIDELHVYIGNLAGEIYCFNKHDGALVWKTKTDGIFNSTPFISQNYIYLNDLFRRFMVIDKQNGEVLKNLELEGRGKLSPVFYNNKLIIGYDDGIIAAYEIVK